MIAICVDLLLLPTVLLGNVLAYLTTAMVGADNDITLTAKVGGAGGNAINLVLVDPSGNNQALAVSVAETTITVSLATGGAGAITSTAAQVVAAINADAAAKLLVTAAVKSGETGAGIVTALTSTALAGGDASAITSASLDLQGFDSGHFNVHFGATAPAPTSVVVKESDDNSAFTDAAAADVIVPTGAHAVNTTGRWAYVGAKRYARIVVTPNGATDVTITGHKGYADQKPTANPA